ncbi:MAG TPA: hypothetical protein VG937_07050 [Polyangiaceae bacterium]|nr:hypothetical protein [Polyangiaceae bacterium]
MTKVAEDYRSAPERSSHPLLSPEGSDFSRWWEQESPRTLAGLGPFTKHESFEHAEELEADVLDLLGAGSDDDENEPTRLLARSLLQLAPPPDARPALSLEPTLPPEPELGLPHSDSRLKVALARESREAPPAAEAPARLEPAQPAPTTTALDPSKLDEFARRISHESVLHRWMANSSPKAAPPSLLVTPKVELPAQVVSAPTAAPAVQALARSVEPRLSKFASDGLRLARSRTFAALAGVTVVALLMFVFLSRSEGAQASAQQSRPNPAPVSKAIVNAPAQMPVTLPAPAPAPAPAFITLRAGSGAEHALVELIGDGHLRAIEALPVRIPANRAETYRVQARRAGYRDFSAELAFDAGDSEKDVLIELTPVKAPLPAQAAQGAPAPWLQAAPPSVPPSSPVQQGNATGQTLVRLKANAGPVAPGSASLSVNSIPISTVIVDGRSQGLTPRVLQVAPGSHTVVFVHPELGRRLVSVEVNSGTTAVAAVRF